MDGYPETIEKTIIDDREHPEMIITDFFQGKYRVHDSFWDDVKYQSHPVGARYGYKSRTLARKAHDAQVAKCRERWATPTAAKRDLAQMQAQAQPLKPRVRRMAIARQIA